MIGAPQSDYWIKISEEPLLMHGYTQELNLVNVGLVVNLGKSLPFPSVKDISLEEESMLYHYWFQSFAPQALQSSVHPTLHELCDLLGAAAN